MRTAEQQMADYRKFRGKCKKLAEAAVLREPTLRIVRGHYYCHAYGKQPHWWCETPDGTVVDPSARQFPSNGNGVYEPFDGVVECAGSETSGARCRNAGLRFRAEARMTPNAELSGARREEK